MSDVKLRPLFADDIFISYARDDSTTYANGLGDRLTKEGFACFIDTLGTETGRDLPPSLRRTIRSCAMLVVIATKWSGTRESIREEIVEFKKPGSKRSADIVPINLDGSLREAIWLDEVDGIAPAKETNRNALNDGNPCDAVIQRIVKAFRYRRRSERLRRWTIAVAVILVLMIAAATVAGTVAFEQLARAREASAVAVRQEKIAAARRTVIAADSARAQSLRPAIDWSEKLHLSALLSVEAYARLVKLGISPADAAQSLRESLDLLPRSVGRYEHEHEIEDAVLSGDGTYFLTREDDGFLRVWNTDTHARIWEVKLEDAVTVLDPNRTLLATSSHRGLSVHALPGGELLWAKERIDHRDLQFRADGSFLAAAVFPQTIVVWDAKSGEDIARVRHRGEARGFALSPVDRVMALSVVDSGENFIEIWSFKTRVPTRLRRNRVTFRSEWNTDGGPLSGLTFSPDGNLLAAIAGHRASILAIDRGEELTLVQGSGRGAEMGRNEEEVQALSFGSDGRTLGTIGTEGTLQTWDVATGGISWSGSRGGGTFRDWMQFYGVDDDRGGSRIVDVRSGVEVARVLHDGRFDVCDYAPARDRLLCYEEKNLWLYDTGSAQEAARIAPHAALFQMAGRRAVLLKDTAVIVFDVIEARETARLQHTNPVQGAVALDGKATRAATITADNRLHLWDVRAKRELWQIDDPSATTVVDEETVFIVEELYFSRTGRFLVQEAWNPDDEENEEAVRVWDVRTQREIAATKRAFSVIDGEPEVRFTSDDRYMILYGDAPRVIDTANGHIVTALGSEEGNGPIVISRDDVLMARFSNGAVDVLEIVGGKRRYSIPLGSDDAEYAFDPRGKYIVAAGGDPNAPGEIREAATGRLLAKLTVTSTSNEIIFSRSGMYVALLSHDFKPNRAEVAVWSLATGRRVASASINDSGRDAVFSPNERYLAITDSSNGRVRVLDLSNGQIVATLSNDGARIDAAFSTDNRFLITTTGERAAVWESGTWREIARLRHDDDVNAAMMTPRGQLATMTERGIVHHWILDAEQLVDRACSALPVNFSRRQWMQNFHGELYSPRCRALTAAQ